MADFTDLVYDGIVNRMHLYLQAALRTSPPELADIPDDLWANAKVLPPVNKTAISMRVDDDVLEWFRSFGPRYQSRMNAVLRSYMEHARKRGRKGPT